MINFNSNIRLSPVDNDRYQSVYASQSYGTFYGIFAKFTVQDIIENDQVIPNKKLLESINLRLINYKGVLNLSLQKDSDVDTDAFDNVTNLNSILIKVKVKAAVNGDSNDKDTIIFDPPIEIKNDMYLTFVRELLTFFGQSHKELMDSNTMTPYAGGVFDDEFYDRNGAQIRKKEVVGFSLSESSGDYIGSDFETSLQLNFPGVICQKGDILINVS